MRFPAQPTWPMFTVLLAVTFAATFAGAWAISGFEENVEANAHQIDAVEVLLDETINNQSVILENQEAGRQRTFQSQSVACITQITLLTDQSFPLSGVCVLPEVAVHYPAEVCATLPIEVEGCGTESEAVP